MKTWRVYATVTGSKYLGEVEAETEEEAKEKAFDLDAAYISLCHACSTHCEDAEITEVVAEEAEA